MIYYRGYSITEEFGHYVVKGVPHDEEVTWAEDTVEDAKHTIDCIENSNNALYGRN